MVKKLLITLLILVLFAPYAGSETEKLPFGLKIWYPDGWQKAYEPSRLIARSPDGSCLVMFIVFETGDQVLARNMMIAELTRIFNGIKVVTEPMPAKINKLESIVLDGTGTVGGVYVMWVARLIVHNKKALMVLGCVESSKFTANNDIISKVIQGVKK